MVEYHSVILPDYSSLKKTSGMNDYCGKLLKIGLFFRNYGIINHRIITMKRTATVQRSLLSPHFMDLGAKASDLPICSEVIFGATSGITDWAEATR